MKNRFHSDPTTHLARLFQKGTHYLLRIVFRTFDHGVEHFLATNNFIATGDSPRHLYVVATQGVYFYEK